jgi:hypothetical protein
MITPSTVVYEGPTPGAPTTGGRWRIRQHTCSVSVRAPKQRELSWRQSQAFLTRVRGLPSVSAKGHDTSTQSMHCCGRV